VRRKGRLEGCTDRALAASFEGLRNTTDDAPACPSVFFPKNNSGRILLRPLPRNTAQGASRIQDINGTTSCEVSARYDVFFIFFFFFGFVEVAAMTLFLL